MPGQTMRYHSLAIILHWVMAVAVLFMLLSGLAVEYLATLTPADKFKLIQLHKSFGICLLVAFFLRVAVRLWQKPPALPASFKPWEHHAAAWGHRALYAMLLLMPLTGWLMVSSSPYGLPTIVFNIFEWPHIPGLAANEAVNGATRLAHTIFAFTLLALIAIHIGAVGKHFMIDRHNLLHRMWWTKKGQD